MYTHTNFKTKKALKNALAEGKVLRVYQPGGLGGPVPSNGTVFLEGPHYPEPHRYYASAVVENGIIVKVK